MSLRREEGKSRSQLSMKQSTARELQREMAGKSPISQQNVSRDWEKVGAGVREQWRFNKFTTRRVSGVEASFSSVLGAYWLSCSQSEPALGEPVLKIADGMPMPFRNRSSAPERERRNIPWHGFNQVFSHFAKFSCNLKKWREGLWFQIWLH